MKRIPPLTHLIGAFVSSFERFQAKAAPASVDYEPVQDAPQSDVVLEELGCSWCLASGAILSIDRRIGKLVLTGVREKAVRGNDINDGADNADFSDMGESDCSKEMSMSGEEWLDPVEAGRTVPAGSDGEVHFPLASYDPWWE